MEKKRKSKFYVLVVLLLVVLVVILSSIFNRSKEPEDITDGQIRRTYDQLRKYLDEEPGNITDMPYQEHIPKIIQSDIKEVVNSDEELKIIYSNDEGSSIIISKDEESPLGIRIEPTEEDDYISTYEFTDHFSFYKKGENIVLYGSNNEYREIDSVIISNNNVAMGNVWDDSRDLFGTEIQCNADAIYTYNKEVTLVRIGNEFLFYRLGKQVGETFKFPGNIKDANHYYYYLNDKNDLYYLYYTDNTKKPWVKFIKVAENIDSIIEDKTNYFSGLATTETIAQKTSVKHPIYIKDGKRYSGITNPETEFCFGTNYGRTVDIDIKDVDFKLYTLELDSNIDSVIFEMRGDRITDYDWYAKTYYKVGTYQVYTEERINGLDSYLSTIIPEEKLKKFDGKKVKAEKKDEVIKKLRKLYKKYE